MCFLLALFRPPKNRPCFALDTNHQGHENTPAKCLDGEARGGGALCGVFPAPSQTLGVSFQLGLTEMDSSDL